MSTRYLSSGDLARVAGVNVETLRYYERRGILRAPARTESGHRRYDPASVALLRLVRRAQALGWSGGRRHSASPWRRSETCFGALRTRGQFAAMSAG